jgi:hypothetical protein
MNASNGSMKGKETAVRPVPPNPSIEGMTKRLRLLVTPHVKR